ncbi:MAG: HpcH/HpaI aldolase family protein [Desulfocapsaceae bacterium]
MKPNTLRQLLNENKPTLGTRVMSSWPSIVETLGHTGMFDYVEFLSEYAPFDLYALDDFCRAAELYNLSTMIKVDQEPRGFLAQRGIGAGFQSVLFADCRSAEDAKECVDVVLPETPEDGGTHGVGVRRFSFMGHYGTPEYVKTLKDIVVVLMIEKKSAVEKLDEILSVKGIDMIQWGPADYSMSIGQPGAYSQPDIKAVERKVIETALKYGVHPRVEIEHMDQAQYYIDLGVRHFNLGIDINILFNWWKKNGEELRKCVADA